MQSQKLTNKWRKKDNKTGCFINLCIEDSRKKALKYYNCQRNVAQFEKYIRTHKLVK